jgi:hypothetical protein
VGESSRETSAAAKVLESAVAASLSGELDPAARARLHTTHNISAGLGRTTPFTSLAHDGQ